MSEAVRLRSARGRGVLLATVLGSGIAFLDTTVVNVALPALQRALGTDLAGLQWVMDAYLLFLSALLLVGGALGDRLGRRRVFTLGLIAFAVASALCGLAPTVETLIVARALQGIGAALLVPGSLSIVKSSFDESEQGAAIGAWAGLSGISTALGPLLGGWLIDVASWRWIFFLNLPLAAVAVWASRRFVPESKDPEASRFRLDLAGAALATVSLGATVFALIEGPRGGWGLPSLVAAAVGVIASIGFFRTERRSEAPMLPLELFSSRAFSGANLATLAIYFALSGTMFLLVLELQQVLGYSALMAGAALTPITVLLLVLSPLSGSVGARVGHRWPMAIGALIAAAGILLLLRVTEGRGYFTHVLPGVALFGLGLAGVVAPLTTAVLASVPSGRSGLASGVNNAVARTAGLLAIALLPWIAGLPDDPTAPSFEPGFRRAMWICAVLCAASSVASFALVRPSRAAQ